MRKLFLLVSVFISTTVVVFAQVQIQTTLPTVGLVQKNQLWNLVLVNTTGNPISGRLELVLFDRQTSQELMTASSIEFLLVKGSAMVNVNKLNPINYNYIGIEPDKNLNTLLPAGAYNICYSFIKNPDSDKREILAEECVSFDVEPLSPPMLSFPADSSILEIAPAQFSWTPPLPVSLLKRLQYEVLITEVQDLQKPNEAMSENTPFFNTDQVINNFMTYPAVFPAFESDKWYAWQVTARDGNNYAGKSETWVFKISNQNPVKEIINATPYIQLKKNGAEKTIAANGILRFYYFNQMADTAVTLSVTDITEKRNDDAAKLLLPVVRGDNYIQKDISKMIKVQEGHLYMLEIENSAMEKWYIQFEVKKYK